MTNFIKKIFLILIATCLFFSLFSCSGSELPDSSGLPENGRPAPWRL